MKIDNGLRECSVAWRLVFGESPLRVSHEIPVYTEKFSALIGLSLISPAPERQSMASPAVDFARSNQPRFVDELKNLLRIPSISTLDEHKSDVEKAAAFVARE